MASFKKARSQRDFYSESATKERKLRGMQVNHQDAKILSSKGYFKTMALHGIFLHRAFGINPVKWLGESNVVKRLKE